MLRGTQACGHRIRGTAELVRRCRAELSHGRRCFTFYVVIFIFGYSYFFFYIAYCVFIECGRRDGRVSHGRHSRTHGPPS